MISLPDQTRTPPARPERKDDLGLPWTRHTTSMRLYESQPLPWLDLTSMVAAIVKQNGVEPHEIDIYLSLHDANKWSFDPPELNLEIQYPAPMTDHERQTYQLEQALNDHVQQHLHEKR